MAEFEISATIEVDGPFFDEDAEVVMRGPEGPSAYELAVEEGFEGTLEEWLDSLGGSLAPNSLGILDPDEVAETITAWGGMLGVSQEVIDGTIGSVTSIVTDQPSTPQVALQNAALILALLVAQNGKAAADTAQLAEILEERVGQAEAALTLKLDASEKGAPGGLAELDGSGLVLSSQLPSYVDDVIVVADYAALPGTGADGKIYVTSDTNLSYRWTGSAYTEISKSLALGTTSSTAYRGDHGAATAAGLADGSGVSDPAAFRGNLGLTYLATQPAIYRTDITAGAIDVDLLDAALASTIAAATPNTRTITAGTGLTGGGTLASDRTIAIDTATLARIGTTVEATSDTAARTSTTAVADGTLEFTAAANTSYRIDAYLIFQGDATADLLLGFTIPAGTMHLTLEGALTTVASDAAYDRFFTLTPSATTTVVGIAGASTPISVRVTGVIRPTSAGTVALIWAPNATGAGTGVTRLARSQLYYRAV